MGVTFHDESNDSNYIYLVPLIIGQNFCVTCAKPNQTGPGEDGRSICLSVRDYRRLDGHQDIISGTRFRVLRFGIIVPSFSFLVNYTVYSDTHDTRILRLVSIKISWH